MSLALLDRLFRALSVVLLLALLISVTAGVISRQVNMPLGWTDELAQYLLVWTGFCGWMIASRKQSHIRITVFAERLPPAAQRLLEMATQAGLIALGCGLVWYSRALIVRNWDVDSISVPLPAAVLYLPLPVLGLLIVAQGLIQLRDAARGRSHIDGGQIL